MTREQQREALASMEPHEARSRLYGHAMWADAEIDALVAEVIKLQLNAQGFEAATEVLAKGIEDALSEADQLNKISAILAAVPVERYGAELDPVAGVDVLASCYGELLETARTLLYWHDEDSIDESWWDDLRAKVAEDPITVEPAERLKVPVSETPTDEQ